MGTSSPNSGNYRRSIMERSDITMMDFYNPWNFYSLLNQDNKNLNEWLVDNKFLLRTMPCTKSHQGCTGTMKLSQRTGRMSGASLPCDINRNHEVTIRTFSFFEGSKLCVQDVFMFIRCYLDGMTLLQTCIYAGVNYKSTGVDWASFLRELFKEHFHRYTKNKTLSGDIETDESLFGRRVKYHRGNPNKGLKAWVFGIVDRRTNSIILYPVENRTKETLIPLIQRHVERGSTIYSDGWTAYCDLNALGYRHFTVLHKYAFQKKYKNVETGEIVTVNTYRIEGAWKHAKQHFMRLSGTHASQWEGHLAEIMWRSEVKEKRYKLFFDLLRTIYNLQGPPQYIYSTPLFDSWSGPVLHNIGDWTVEPILSDDENDDISTDDSQQDLLSVPETSKPPESLDVCPDKVIVVSSDDLITLGQRPQRTGIKPATAALLSKLFSSSSDDSGETELKQNENICASACTSKSKSDIKSTRKFKESKGVEPSTSGAIPKKIVKSKKTKIDNVCHLSGFIPCKQDERSRSVHKRTKNPYTKENFFVWSSSNDDFQ